jgi:hypothetical protein
MPTYKVRMFWRADSHSLWSALEKLSIRAPRLSTRIAGFAIRAARCAKALQMGWHANCLS